MNNDYNNNQQPQYQAPMPPQQQPGKGAATGSMVCGIVALATWWLGWGALIGLVLGIVAIVLSIKAKKEGFVGGMATAGMVMGIIGAVLCGIFFVACTVCACIIGNAATTAGSSINWSDFM